MTAPLPAQQVRIDAHCSKCGFTGQVTAFENRATSDLATLTWFCPQCGAGHTRLREIPPAQPLTPKGETQP